ncbi:MAG: DUF255 domain-containing protein [Planctomycetota bacterium]|nr:MAG: DUF255 domain-containing protein [Planctomycetota bacterium]
MAEQGRNNKGVPIRQEPDNITPPSGKKHYRALWTLFVVFFIFVAIIFLAKHRNAIDWVEDYGTGIKMARLQNKPVLLAFYKQHTRFCSDMSQNTYNNPDVIIYVEANFIPILIDVDKQPEIAERYNIDYYPTHYIKPPDSNDLIGPHLGYDTPSVFIRKLKDLLRQLKSPAE